MTNVWLNSSLDRDVALAVKRDGTWIIGVVLATGPGANFTTDGNKLLKDGNPVTILNDSGATQQFDKSCLIAEADNAAVITALNADEGTVADLLAPVIDIEGSPVSVQNGQSLRFTEISIS